MIKPVSVMPTESNLLSTSATTEAEVWLNWTNGCENIVLGKRAGMRSAVHVFTASSRTLLCSEVRYMSATFWTSWRGRWAGAEREEK